MKLPQHDMHGNVLTLTLINLEKHDPKTFKAFQDAFLRTFLSDDGAKALDLLENAVLKCNPPPCADDRALREIHGQRLLVAEIRRIVVNAGIADTTNK